MHPPRLNWKARDVMNSRVMATTRRAKVKALALQLLAGTSTGIPVVELSGEVVGIVTEFDVLKAVQEGKDLHEIEAGDIMTENPLCVEENAPAEAVIQKMIEHKIIRIPVVREKKLIGNIARTDILNHILEPEVISFVN